jgi:hypothetical protein
MFLYRCHAITSQTTVVPIQTMLRCEASRRFRNKKREYVKDKINELATKSKNKNIRDLA